MIQWFSDLKSRNHVLKILNFSFLFIIAKDVRQAMKKLEIFERTYKI